MFASPHRRALLAGLIAAGAIVLVQWLGRRAVAGTLGVETYGALVAFVCLAAGALLLRDRRAPPDVSLVDRLTQRERQILELMAAGKANKEIATALHVEVSTVKTHANNLFAKLGCANRRDAQRLWTRWTASPPSFHPPARSP